MKNIKKLNILLILVLTLPLKTNGMNNLKTNQNKKNLNKNLSLINEEPFDDDFFTNVFENNKDPFSNLNNGFYNNMQISGVPNQENANQKIPKKEIRIKIESFYENISPDLQKKYNDLNNMIKNRPKNNGLKDKLKKKLFKYGLNFLIIVEPTIVKPTKNFLEKNYNNIKDKFNQLKNSNINNKNQKNNIPNDPNDYEFLKLSKNNKKQLSNSFDNTNKEKFNDSLKKNNINKKTNNKRKFSV